MIVALLALAVAALALYLTSAQASLTPETYQGKTARAWYVQLHKVERVKLRQTQKKLGAVIRSRIALRKAFVHRPSSLEAIRLASITYGASYSEMVRIASCESPGLVTNLRNASSASGLFQFLDSTWARSRYGSEDVYSPYANALAAAWLWRADGRSWREWVCSPG